jgi:hypothetical protein
VIVKAALFSTSLRSAIATSLDSLAKILISLTKFLTMGTELAILILEEKIVNLASSKYCFSGA